MSHLFAHDFESVVRSGARADGDDLFHGRHPSTHVRYLHRREPGSHNAHAPPVVRDNQHRTHTALAGLKGSEG